MKKSFFARFILSLSVICAGCVKHETYAPHPKPAETIVVANDGGVDGSGGITGLSTISQVRASHETTKTVMLHALRRVKMVLESDGNNEDKRWSTLRIKLLREMFSGNELLTTGVLELFESSRINWSFKEDAACDSEHGPADGAAKPPAQLCISLYRLSRFSYRDLSVRLIQLYAHELAHLYFGKTEEKPTEVAAFFTEIYDLVFPETIKIRAAFKTFQEMAQPPKGILKNYQEIGRYTCVTGCRFGWQNVRLDRLYITNCRRAGSEKCHLPNGGLW